jgi:type II secretory pathway pseudopilin PulG
MTLIELLVVCLIIGIAFMGLAGLFPLGVRNVSQSRMRTVATDLAQEKMEELLTMNKTSPDLNGGSHTDPDNPVRQLTVTAIGMNRYWTITDDTPVTGMKKIEVRVTYPHGSDLRDVTLVTYRGM